MYQKNRIALFPYNTIRRRMLADISLENGKEDILVLVLGLQTVKVSCMTLCFFFSYHLRQFWKWNNLGHQCTFVKHEKQNNFPKNPRSVYCIHFLKITELIQLCKKSEGRLTLFWLTSKIMSSRKASSMFCSTWGDNFGG